jgi:hypothetical protein
MPSPSAETHLDQPAVRRSNTKTPSTQNPNLRYALLQQAVHGSSPR